MKSRLKNPFLRFTLITGQYLISAGQVTAQNFADWPVTHVAAGGNHTLFTRADGTVFVMGDNTYGQLGLGPTVAKVNVPTALTNSVGLIAAGGAHSLMVRGHALLAMGYNNHGQLGDDTTNNQFFPEQVFTVGNFVRLTAVAAGYSYSLFLTTSISAPSGGLQAMGWNGNGQLGDGTYTDQHAPEEVLSYSLGQPGIVAIAAGFSHSLFVKSDGSVWDMGANARGQLGDYTYSDTNNPEEGPRYTSGVTAVAAGCESFDSLFIWGGYLFGMGDNEHGQLAILPPSPEYQDQNYPYTLAGPNLNGPIGANHVIAVASGTDFTLMLVSDGSLWGVGGNFYGQLGAGGSDYFTDQIQMIEASNVVAVAAGGTHSLFIKSDGSLWGMGGNYSGQLGTGDYAERNTPVEIVAAPPKIAIIPYASNVILAWPTNAAAFVLQSTSSLASPNWTTVTPGPIIVGNECEEFHPASVPQLYYRLALNR